MGNLLSGLLSTVFPYQFRQILMWRHIEGRVIPVVLGVDIRPIIEK